MPDTSPLPQFPIELSDADATLKVQALVAGAEDTGELTAADILEEEPAAATTAAASSPDVVVEIEIDDPFPSPRALPKPTPPRRPLPPPPVAPGRGSISFAPVAMDLALEPPRSRRRADSTVLVPRVRDAQTHRLYQLVGAAAVLALFGLGSLVTTFVIGFARPAPSAASAANAAATSETRTAARSEKELDLRPAERSPQTPEPPPAWAAAAAAPAPPAVHAADPPRPADPPSTPPATASLVSATRAPATGHSTGVGTIRVPPSVHGMLVDGHPRRVDGATTVTCGRHVIKTGITPSRTVDVPCGGTAWL